MKYSELLKQKKGSFITTILCLTCVLSTALTLFNEEMHAVFACYMPMRHWWQFFSGIFVHGTPNHPIWFNVLLHLLPNLLVLFPCAVLLEKLIGGWRFGVCSFFIVVLNAGIACFMNRNAALGDNAFYVGISAVACSYGVFALYVVIRMILKERKAFFRHIASYLLLVSVFVFLLYSRFYIPWSFNPHWFGSLIGLILFPFLLKRINASLKRLYDGSYEAEKPSNFIYLWLLLPLFYTVVYAIFENVIPLIVCAAVIVAAFVFACLRNKKKKEA